MSDGDDVMARLRALCEALITANAVTRDQIAESAQEHLLNLVDDLPPELQAAAFPRLRSMGTTIQRLSGPAQRG